MAPYDITLGQFMYVVRKRIKIDDSESLYFFVNDNQNNLNFNSYTNPASKATSNVLSSLNE